MLIIISKDWKYFKYSISIGYNITFKITLHITNMITVSFHLHLTLSCSFTFSTCLVLFILTAIFIWYFDVLLIFYSISISTLLTAQSNLIHQFDLLCLFIIGRPSLPSCLASVVDMNCPELIYGLSCILKIWSHLLKLA